MALATQGLKKRLPLLNRKEVIKVLMSRDELSLEEAEEECDGIEEQMQECIDDGDFEGAYDALAEYGLEPDYIF